MFPSQDTQQYRATTCDDLMPTATRYRTIVVRDSLLRSRFRRGDIMGMAAPLYYSAEMVRALPDDGNRYETVHGELLVTPAPRVWHQEIVFRLGHGLHGYLADIGLGHLFQSPADISWGPDTLVQPDLFVVELDQARSLDWSQMNDLLLTIEVLSPTTARYDRHTKRRLYQEVGIPDYWIVDPDEKLIEVWTPEDQFPTVERERVRWKPEGVEQEFVMDLAELFKPI
jgi:Uma2 family endonuclease